MHPSFPAGVPIPALRMQGSERVEHRSGGGYHPVELVASPSWCRGLYTADPGCGRCWSWVRHSPITVSTSQAWNMSLRGFPGTGTCPLRPSRSSAESADRPNRIYYHHFYFICYSLFKKNFFFLHFHHVLKSFIVNIHRTRPQLYFAFVYIDTRIGTND